MDWMQILREFGVPTLYAVVLLAYFVKMQNFLQQECVFQPKRSAIPDERDQQFQTNAISDSSDSDHTQRITR